MTGAEVAAVGTQGTFSGHFHVGTLGRNLQQTKPQACTRAASAHRSLTSFNDAPESQRRLVSGAVVPTSPSADHRLASGAGALSCAPGTRASATPLRRFVGRFRVVKQRAKARFFFQRERGVHVM